MVVRAVGVLGDVNNEDSDNDDGEERRRSSLVQKAERSHLIVWQVFTDS